MRRIAFGPQVCGRLAEGATREWLVPDGRGGFAMGTVSGLRTRRYHGLLVVAGDTPATRHLGLASLDPVLTLSSGAVVRLGTHEWAGGAVEPRGHELLASFELVDGLPRWRWRVGDVVLERELAMVHGRPAVAVVHRLLTGGPVSLRLEALVTWRDVHGERTADGPPPEVTATADGCRVAGAYRLRGPDFRAAGQWFRGVRHREEAARGLTPEEDLWYAGSFHAELRRPGDTAPVTAWAGPGDPPAPADQVVAGARARNRAVVAAAAPGDSASATLALAADAFIVRTAAGPDVVAGYPWFGAWSRDTMLAYEGLFLDTGRADEGRDLLTVRTRAAARAVRDPQAAATPWASRDSVDAPLWLVHAVERHVTRTGDGDLAAALVTPLLRLLRHRLNGSGPLSVDPADELLRLGPDPAGPPGAEAFSWMNAYTDEGPVTPRIGKPVEINALWVNALAALAQLLEEAGRDGGELRARHHRARDAFRSRFAAPEGWLYDVVEGPASAYPLGAGSFHDDPSLRPNQLLGWSLPHAPMAGTHAGAVREIGRSLLTPLGVRTLAPTEYGYQGAHRGGRDERDIAYHQGTVWPWLIGPYADACAATGLPTDGLLTGLVAHTGEWGVGSVSETADGDAPHRATGSPFSARSVAEVLRVMGWVS